MNEAVIKNLERSHSEIMSSKDVYDELFSLAIYDYVEITQKVMLTSSAWHEFYHQMHEEWEKELYEAEEKFGKELKDFSNEEKEFLHRKSPYFLWIAYHGLEEIHDDVKKLKKGEELDGKQWQRLQMAKEWLQRVHQSIVSKIEEKEDLEKEEVSKEESSSPVDGIYYHPVTGVGWANGKNFKFKDNQPEYHLFRKLYEGIGNKVARENVLDILGVLENSHLATDRINDIAKKIRKRTGLKTTELVVNNGNMTLVGTRLENLPK